MHDLNVLSRLNAEAYADAIANLRRQGRDVVATYNGATLMAIESFTIAAQAAAALAAPTASPDEHRKLFAGFRPDHSTPFPEIGMGHVTGERPMSPTCDGSGDCRECEHNREHNEQGLGDEVPYGFRVVHVGNLDEVIGAILGRQL